MFRLINKKEEDLILKTIKICILKSGDRISDTVNADRHNIYFYQENFFKDGMTVFNCTQNVTASSFILDSIRTCEDSAIPYDIDEEIVYALIPLLIKFSVKLATLAKKEKVILESNIPHFAEHLVDNRFNIYRVYKGLPGDSDITIRGIKTIKSEIITHGTSINKV